MNGIGGTGRRPVLSAPRRNRFFHGKMMDVHHFELETDYGIGMRRMLNRLVTGTGVVCGLDVVSEQPGTLQITPGLALDKWGREIVVPERSAPVRIPQDLADRVCERGVDGGDHGDGGGGDSEEYGSEQGRGTWASTHQHRCEPERGWLTVVLCYHECQTEPVAVLAGDCGTTTPCAPGAIREQYRVELEPGRVRRPRVDCRFPDVLSRGELNYAALADWVTRQCPPPPRNPCVPLASVRLDCAADGVEVEDIDITVRPIVFGNDLLVDVLARLVEASRSDGYSDR